MTDQIPELSLAEAWKMIAGVPDAVLIDVRTAAEWCYVGQPDLGSVGKQVRSVEWIRFPDGSPNPRFIEETTAGLSPDQPLLLICRSGTRSRAAARTLAAAGFTETYNVTDGFEGDLDATGHRTSGWKGAGLPWRQN
jgi:rhodanese-related sulfurtransferase